MPETPDASPAPRPAPRGSASPVIYEALKQDILNLTLAPGDPLDETGLSDRFGTSRTPVREALVRLVAEGLASTLPNRNTIVSVLDFSSLPPYLDALTLMYRLSCRLAAQRRTEADLDAIMAAQAKFLAAVDRQDALAMLHTNRDFHLAIAAAGQNPYYAEFFARLLNEGMRLLRLYYKRFDDRLPAQYSDEHEGLIEAIAAQNADLAEILGGDHAMQIVVQLQTLLVPSAGLVLDLRASP
ncbi:GntR family transcriptional regulator [Elstera cyanobacteriorum]|uniref:GntR family transcriptional regulator n=1 Tax=Elstera cyanobacteriorum TaxID=2022747 RepID=A0A255XTI0_9PROT|nr:GntR family transcriptional regulator [Elstera cyanobacteriorum]MCK6444390.1 GntR family transcriptional regulator [Elstera cyanobacteriorum]OYQ20191.1 GntR family transcriptional regulator [Elstera cyanobacteriorum]GFZ81115.1 GntR family transcriptional regulator [Elstera cyanobacteriorum]